MSDLKLAARIRSCSTDASAQTLQVTCAHRRRSCARGLVDGGQRLRRHEGLGARHAQLLQRVCEEADAPPAPHAVIAQLRPIPAMPVTWCVSHIGRSKSESAPGIMKKCCGWRAADEVRER